MEGEDAAKMLTLRQIALYITFLILITCSFEFVPSRWLEVFTAEFSSSALRVLGFSSGWGVNDGEAYLLMVGGVRDVSVTIIRECTGIHVFAIFAGLVLSVSGGLWLRKMLSLTVAGSFLLVLNISRVMLTILLTAYDVPPFAWIFTNPTVETYHYPLSFIYGFLGVAILVVIIDRWILPELGETLTFICRTFYNLIIRARDKSKI
jgi:exosortase/archaeosortase family protein